MRGIRMTTKAVGLWTTGGNKVIGSMKDLKPILDMNRLDEIAITLSLKEITVVWSRS